MMRIAIDCRMIGSGGIGSFISELIPYFLTGNECLLLGSHEQCASFLNLPNVEFCFCNIPPFSLKEVFLFPQDILERINNYDYYFTPYCNIPGGINIPIFTTIHDVVFLDLKELTSFAGRFIRKMFYKRAINYSDAIFTVSKFSKERIQYHLHPKKQIVIVYNSAPSYLKRPFEDGLPQKKDQILFVGNIKKHKGLKTLLDAYEIAAKNDKTFRSKLLIVGNAENFRTGDQETIKKIQALQKENHDGEIKIEFTGKISNERLKYLYAESRYLVQPSLYEGFGIPPLEAMTVGTPAIISDIPVFKEIYSTFPVSFFKAGNASDLAEKIIEMNKSVTDSFSLDKICDVYSYERSAKIICDTMLNFKN